jgi:hypothetical protein
MDAWAKCCAVPADHAQLIRTNDSLTLSVRNLANAGTPNSQTTLRKAETFLSRREQRQQD